MHIIENYNARAGRVYCYVAECMWDKETKKRIKPRIAIGHLEGKPSIFVPNKTFASLIMSDKENPSTTDKRERDIIDLINAKYGNNVGQPVRKPDRTEAQTARAVFSGPAIVFGGITSRYHIDTTRHYKTLGSYGAGWDHDVLQVLVGRIPKDR